MSSPLPSMDAGERLQADFEGQNLITGPPAMSLLRPHLPAGTWTVADFVYAHHGQRVRVAGNVICRQQPGTARGFVFVSLEDETGIANVIVPPALFEQRRLTISQEAFLLIEGHVQVAEGTIHIKAEELGGLQQLGAAHAASHDFHSRRTRATDKLRKHKRVGKLSSAVSLCRSTVSFYGHGVNLVVVTERVRGCSDE